MQDFSNASELLGERDARLRSSGASGIARFEGLVRFSEAIIEAGDLSRADEVLTEACKIADEQYTGRWQEAWSKTLRADTLIRSGKCEEAATRLLQSKEIIEQPGLDAPRFHNRLPQKIEQLLQQSKLPQ